MATPRFAYSSPLQAGERRTVRHVIGALRQIRQRKRRRWSAQAAVTFAATAQHQLRVLSDRSIRLLLPPPDCTIGTLDARLSTPPLGSRT